MTKECREALEIVTLNATRAFDAGSDGESQMRAYASLIRSKFERVEKWKETAVKMLRHYDFHKHCNCERCATVTQLLNDAGAKDEGHH